MRKGFFNSFCFCLILCLCLLSPAQKIIENPEKPPGKNAGRVIRLKEVLRIKDVKGKFYFKGPWDVKVAKDGSIFVHEPDRLLMFNPDGKFIRNLYKKGEGPGELNQNLSDLLLLENGIILASSNMNKIIRTNTQGELIEEIRPKPITFNGLLGYHNGKYIFFDYIRGDYERKTGIFEDYLKLCTADVTGEVIPTSNVFPVTVSRYVDSRVSSGGPICRMQKVSKDPRYVYLFHTPEYLVRLLDLERCEVIKSFNRKYKRVKFVFERKLPFSSPRPKFCNDIQRLLIHRSNLWVVTSTLHKDKGILVDVFNGKGKYLDNFYLPLFRILTEERLTYYAPMDIHDDYLVIVEIGEDDLISIAKYEIIDK